MSRRALDGMFVHIISVMFQAGAISSRPLMRSASRGASAISARSSKSAMLPPMLEPISTCGPSLRRSKTLRASSSHRLSVPSSKRPSDSPWPE